MSNIELSEYAELAAAVRGRPSAELTQALEVTGASRARWKAAKELWEDRVSYDPEIQRQFDRLVREALERQVGCKSTLDLGTFVEITARLRLGRSVPEAIADTGLSEREYYLGAATWRDRMWDDRQLGGLFEAKARLRTAELMQPALPLPAPETSQVVFAHRCHGCGGHKMTRPRTAYIYCDYCAKLFDYDWELVQDTLFGLDPYDLFALLHDPVRPALKESREAGDWDRYRQIWYWVYDADMEIAPRSWSPRIGDPAYREAMARWSVETCVVRNTSKDLQQAIDDLHEQIEEISDAPEIEIPTLQLAALRKQLETETGIYADHGLLTSHPDELDADTYHRINLAIHLRSCIEGVDGEARQRAIESSGLARSIVQVPPSDATRSVCGRCGGQLLVLADSHRVVCEACGIVLERSQRRFSCPGCAAPVLITSGEHHLQCGFCEANFSVS